MNLHEIKNEYLQSKLSASDVLKSPWQQFRLWLKNATDSDIREPTAMILSTCGLDCRISSRTVLLKGIKNEESFIFYTNYASQKAKQMEQNRYVSLLFPWYRLERQVIIQGSILKTSSDESKKYFHSRSRSAQIAAMISKQSSIIASRQQLDEKFKDTEKKLKKEEIPYPNYWGGYAIIPDIFEFWQGRKNRMHDRIVYTLTEKDKIWTINRRSP